MIDDTTPPGSSPDQPAPASGGQWHPPSLPEMQSLLPQYEFLGLVGRGGMGAVYKAVQISLDRPVAIKILPPGMLDEAINFTERFKIEARTMAKMNHPGIVSVYDFGVAAGSLLYIVMEFVDGTDVAQMIQSQGRLPPAHALAITAHVSDALRYAHERGVVHRDIKPANILISREGQVKVADFGLAGMSGALPQHTATDSAQPLGTPNYVAPEVLVPGASVDGRADLFSLGVMLYNMLTGEVPRGVFQLPAQKVGCDPRYDMIVRKAMEQDPAKRFQSALEVRRMLDTIQTVPVAKSDPAQPFRPPGSTRPIPKRSSYEWVWSLAVVLFLGALAAFVVWNSKSHKSQPQTEAPVAVVPTTPEPTPPLAPISGTPSAPPASPTAKQGQAPVAPIKDIPRALLRLRDLDAQFYAALDRDVINVREAALADLNLKYNVALDRALTAASSSVIMDETLALRAEKQRLETRQPLPDDEAPALPDSLQQLRQTYRSAVAKIESDAYRTWNATHAKYDQVLSAYKDELTKNKQPDEAKRVAVKRLQIMAQGTAPRTRGPAGESEYVIKKGPDGLILEDGHVFTTGEAFTPPVEITVVAKTNGSNLRLGYAASQLIFNWEMNPKELRVDGGPAGGKHQPGAGSIPKDQFVTVRWVVTPGSQTVFVDGQKRFEHQGDYSRLSRAFTVFPHQSTLTVQSVKVRRHAAPPVFTPGSKLAQVQVVGASFQPLTAGAQLYGDHAEDAWQQIPAFFSAHRFSRAPYKYTPAFHLKVLSDGMAFMACPSNVADGSVSRAFLEAQGWQRYEPARDLKSSNDSYAWPVFVRNCKAGETFRYPTEKLITPVVITDAASAVDNAIAIETAELPGNEGVISKDTALKPMRYENRKRLSIGVNSSTQPMGVQPVTVASFPKTEITDSSISCFDGVWHSTGTRFARCSLSFRVDTLMDARDTVFEACRLERASVYAVDWFSSKWVMENCIITRSFMQGWSLKNIGVNVSRCTFYNVAFEPVRYSSDAAMEVKLPWLQIKSCRFVDCKVPESVLIATQNCVFENCTFGASERDIPIKSPLTTQIYVPAGTSPPQTGPNRTVEVLDAARISTPVGSTVKHVRRGSIINLP